MQLLINITFEVLTFLFQIINQCNKAEKWLREKMQQQDTLPKSSDPVFWSSEIESKTENLKLYDFTLLFFLFQKCIIVGYNDNSIGSELHTCCWCNTLFICSIRWFYLKTNDCSVLMGFRACQPILGSEGSPIREDRGEGKQNTSNH